MIEVSGKSEGDYICKKNEFLVFWKEERFVETGERGRVRDR